MTPASFPSLTKGVPIDTWLVMNDLQIEFHDEKVCKAILKFARWLRPRGVALLGDIVDNYAISDYDRNPVGPHDLNREIGLCGELLTSLRSIGSIKEREWVDGNHEDRFRKLIWKKAPGLHGAVDFPSLFKIREHGFRWQPYGGRIELGKLHLTHGWMVRQDSCASAKGHLQRMGTSVMHGHTHRLGIYYQTNLDGMKAGYENGHLSVPEGMDYVKHGQGGIVNWQQGFSVVHVARGGFFHVDQIPVLNREVFLFGGKVFKA